MFKGFLSLPPWGMSGTVLILLYAIQAEIRFGSKARASKPGARDRGTSQAVSFAAMVPVIGFVLAMQAMMPSLRAGFPAFLKEAGALPGMPAFAWVGAGLGVLGLAIRMWSVLTLRERYTRTLLIQDEHAIERGGPYRFVRHPGYLGSLLCLNGIALCSGNTWVALASFVALAAAYAYRIRAEDAMLVEQFGTAYESYRREVKAVVPFVI